MNTPPSDPGDRVAPADVSHPVSSGHSPKSVAHVTIAPPGDILPLRTRFRAEMNCQVVHDSIHRREGWTRTYRIDLGTCLIGFGTVAIGGPWKDKPTLFEFYLLPEHRLRAFEYFEALLSVAESRHFEVQSNEVLLTVMLHVYARDIVSERIVFADQTATRHSGNGAVLRQVTPDYEVRACMDLRQGGGQWNLERDGVVVGTGGILFHYNRPYGDIHMEIHEPYRRQGYGRFLVQELKKECYRLGAIPAARCSTENLASRATLQGAGFIPYAHMLLGTLRG